MISIAELSKLSGAKPAKKSRQAKKSQSKKKSLAKAFVSHANVSSHVSASSKTGALGLIRNQIAPKILAGASGNSLAASLMLPTVFPARRLASQYTSAPTAVASPFAVEQSDWTGVPSDLNSSVVLPGQTMYGVCRNPLCSYFQYYPNPTGQQYGYGAWFYGDQGMNQAGTGSNNGTIVYTASATEVPLNPTAWYSLNTSQFAPHGDWYYSVDAASRKGFFLTATTEKPVTILIKVTSGELLGDPRGLLYAWNGDLWTRIVEHLFDSDPSTSSTPALQFTVTTSGYYALAVSAKPEIADYSGLANVSIQFTSTGSVVGFQALPGIDPLLNSVENLRITAASLLVTPHTSTLYEGGQVCAVQLPAGVDPMGVLLSRDPFTDWSEDANSATMVLKKGLYGFLKPTDQRDFDLQSFTRIVEEEIYNLYNPIYPQGGWLVAATSVGLVDGTYPAGIAHITRCYGVEFRTTNVWFQQMGPQTTPQDWARALELIKNAQQFHENPLHFKDILNFISRSGKAALKLAPTVIRLLSPLFPNVEIASAAATLLQHAGSML